MASYSALEDELQGQDFALLVRDHNLDFDRAGLAVKRLLDFFRNRRAVDYLDQLDPRLAQPDHAACRGLRLHTEESYEDR